MPGPDRRNPQPRIQSPDTGIVIIEVNRDAVLVEHLECGVEGRTEGCYDPKSQFSLRGGHDLEDIPIARSFQRSANEYRVFQPVESDG